MNIDNLSLRGPCNATNRLHHDVLSSLCSLDNALYIGQSAQVKPTPWSTVLVAGSLLITACSDVRWVTITQVSATDSESSSLSITIDACADVPRPQVVESNTEVHLLINLKHDYGGDQKSCNGGVQVHLDTPIGTRKVIDDRHHREIALTWTPITQPAQLAGSVSQLLGHEGAASITAWLLVDQSGAAVVCDDLPVNATTCASPSISIDWATGNATPPTDLVKRGTSSVSAGPVTLTGSLKDNTLYVGVEP